MITLMLLFPRPLLSWGNSVYTVLGSCRSLSRQFCAASQSTVKLPAIPTIQLHMHSMNLRIMIKTTEL